MWWGCPTLLQFLWPPSLKQSVAELCPFRDDLYRDPGLGFLASARLPAWTFFVFVAASLKAFLPQLFAGTMAGYDKTMSSLYRAPSWDGSLTAPRLCSALNMRCLDVESAKKFKR